MTARRLAVGAAAFAAVVGVAAVAVAAHYFDDMLHDHPHADYIAVAVDRGWFAGYGDGTFKPDRNISPAQIAKISK